VDRWSGGRVVGKGHEVKRKKDGKLKGWRVREVKRRRENTKFVLKVQK
jgi:hypothetical protein